MSDEEEHNYVYIDRTSGLVRIDVTPRKGDSITVVLFTDGTSIVRQGKTFRESSHDKVLSTKELSRIIRGAFWDDKEIL